MIRAALMCSHKVAGKLTVSDYDNFLVGVSLCKDVQCPACSFKDTFVCLSLTRKLPTAIMIVFRLAFCNGDAGIFAPVTFTEYLHRNDRQMQMLGKNVGGIQGTLQIAGHDALKLNATLTQLNSRLTDLYPTLFGKSAWQMSLQYLLIILLSLSMTDDIHYHIVLKCDCSYITIYSSEEVLLFIVPKVCLIIYSSECAIP